MKYRVKLGLVAFAGFFLSAGCLIYSQWNREPVQELRRPEAGSGTREELLQAELQGACLPIQITIQELPYTEQDAQNMLEDAAEGLETLLLKDNSDLCNIQTDLNMLSIYPQTKIAIQWHMDSWKYVEPDGTVRNEGIATPVPVKIQAVLTLEDYRRTWERELQICPVQNPDEEQKVRILEYQLMEQQKDPGQEVLSLPETLADEPVLWYREPDNRWMWLTALTVLALCAMAAGHRKEEERAKKKRERSMELDYAEIVSRLSLYMGAGISTRKAWERIVENYEKKDGEKEERHFAYDEMRTALYEMQSGVPETLAYERFGMRCRMPSYLKLGTLLSQNLRRGTGNLAALLQEEAAEAFENRKALAKRMGEECESRLLLPMLMMLVTVLIIVMYPALVSFQM